MPNVLLTAQCVRSCPYCFASREMEQTDDGVCLSWEDLIYLADLHVQAGERSIQLLGGEPTLHPELPDMVAYLLARGFHVQIFTSGVVGEARLDKLKEVVDHSEGQPISFTCNLNDPKDTQTAERRSIVRFLETFGDRITPGFNIYKPDFDLAFLIHDINAFGLRRRIRLGLAHPIYGKPNAHIRPEQASAVAHSLDSMFPLLEQHNVTLGLDCGFPMCMFTDAELGRLYRIAHGEVRFLCNPAIDIGPDAKVWACFPLSDYHRKSLYEFDGLRDIGAIYQGLFNQIRVEIGGIYTECDHCAHRQSGLCAGGCAAHLLNAMRDEPPVRKLHELAL